ncbi:hypothetical protein BCR39DRAFT_500027 [Naematelia encephala]|uniref:Cx9C motif-containing protein 4, mitochondrial n=1 Tax=Naematelia encephala TaxID=71784 RepID=A0A1Y2ARK6_9TREE|nr:hypothetical protein BCR39DRAFT_500027 [Naematelia encephala]
MAPPQDCQAEACAIQTCLSKNNYQQSKCDNLVESLYKCCDKMYRAADKEGKDVGDTGSTACPLRSVVTRKLKQFER